MEQSERIERIEAGQSATLAHGFLLEPILEARENIIKRLVSLYRSGQTHHDNILGGIAEIAALDNLMYHLENQIRQGNVAAQQEYGNAEK
jgi:hypothetical protein